MAEKKKKSKQQQAKDMAKLAGVAAAAGVVANRVSKKVGGRGKKSRRLALIVGILVFVLIVGSGAMYYYDLKPLNADWFNGQFKCWYMSPEAFAQSDGNLQIRFLNVGQGDCSLIQLPDGKNMLIDGGKDDKTKEQEIIAALKKAGATTIDYGMLTHTDSDHCGGMDAVIASDEITFKSMYMPLVKSKLADDKVQEWYDEADYLPKDQEPADFSIQSIETTAYAKFMQAVLDEEGCETIFSYAGQQIKGNGYVIDFYNPTYAEYKKISSAKQKNNVSPVMILTFNGKKIMFTGDCDDAEVNFRSTALKDGVENFDVDVLKVAHHGGKESTSEAFLDIVKPEYSVISVAEKNTYGHPTPEVLDRLDKVGSKVFTTKDKGDIVLTLQGDKMGWAFQHADAGEDVIPDDGADVEEVTMLRKNLVASNCFERRYAV